MNIFDAIQLDENIFPSETSIQEIFRFKILALIVLEQTKTV